MNDLHAYCLELAQRAKRASAELAQATGAQKQKWLRQSARLLGERKPILMVCDPPYGIELDSEWRDRAGLNGCGPAAASYMKHPDRGAHRNHHLRRYAVRLVRGI